MANATAGFNGTLEVSDDGSTWTDLGGMDSADFEQILEEIAATEFGDTNVRRIYGLGDASASCSGYADSDDAGQTLIQTNFSARDNVYVRYLYDGTNGLSAEFICTSIATESAVDGRGGDRSYSFSLANGSVTVV